MENEKKSGGDKYSKLAGNTLIFAISSFSSKLLTLIVQPFLTYAMAEISDLGLSKILSQYANLLIPFVSMGMSNAIIRFGLDKGNSEKQVFTNGLLTILGGFGILVLCWPIARFLPDMAQYGLLIYLYVLMSCLRTLCTQFVRSRQWNKLVAVDGVLCTVATMWASSGVPTATCWPSSAATLSAFCSCASPENCGTTWSSGASTGGCGGRCCIFRCP